MSILPLVQPFSLNDPNYPKQVAQSIHTFWFGIQKEEGEDSGNIKLWYQATDEVDQLIKDKFEPVLRDLSPEKITKWRTSDDVKDHLSLIILCDQLTRNMFRGSGEMFAWDYLASSVAKQVLLQQSMYDQLKHWERMFVLMPLMHSEDVHSGRKCLEEMKKLAQTKDKNVDLEKSQLVHFSRVHLDILEQFGRYPHRNELLQRETTTEEEKWLNETELGFIKSVKKKTNSS